MAKEVKYQEILKQIYNQIYSLENKGVAAQYIPELSNINTDQFAVCMSTVDGKTIGIGDYQTKFSIQSISKVFILTLAYRNLGGDLWKRVGVEPSGTGFNSLVQLETDNGIPRNPFMNSGALVISDVLLDLHENAFEYVLEFIQEVSGNPNISYSETVARSEAETGYRNIALCHFIKSFDNLHNDPKDVLDFYFKLCSIEMTCEELSKSYLYLADDEFRTTNGVRILTMSQAKRINAIMQTCGFYDESGEFSYKVGLPGKSGVGGGIIAVHPGKYSFAVWSPKLNKKGNSYRGMKFLEMLTTETNSSIF